MSTNNNRWQDLKVGGGMCTCVKASEQLFWQKLISSQCGETNIKLNIILALAETKSDHIIQHTNNFVCYSDMLQGIREDFSGNLQLCTQLPKI